MTDWSHLIDLEKCTVSPRVFVDEEVYRDEQERVFGRCWLYVVTDYADERKLQEPIRDPVSFQWR